MLALLSVFGVITPASPTQTSKIPTSEAKRTAVWETRVPRRLPENRSRSEGKSIKIGGGWVINLRKT